MRKEEEIRADLAQAQAAMEVAKRRVEELTVELRSLSSLWLAQVTYCLEMEDDGDFLVSRVLSEGETYRIPFERLFQEEVVLTDCQVFPDQCDSNTGEICGYLRLFRTEEEACEWAVRRAREEWARRD